LPIPTFRASVQFAQNHKKLSLLIAVLLIAVLYLGIRSATADENAALQRTAIVKRGDIENSIGSLGTLEPKEYVDVGTQVSGLLDKLLVEIGDTVEQGQLLAEIDPTVYESQVRNARSTIANLQAQLNLQRAELKLAKTRAQRNRNLFEAKAVSRDSLLASETEVEVREARIQSTLAQLDAAQASLDGDLANLGYTKIYAPISGTVVDSSAIEGQTINARQTAPTIVRIAQLNTMTVRAEVSEADVVKIHEGMPVYFTTLGMPKRRWQATVRKVLPTPINLNNVVLYSVLIDVDNSDRALMTSMTTQVFFVQDRAEDTLIVPATALRTPPHAVAKTPQNKTPQNKTSRNNTSQAKAAGTPPSSSTAFVEIKGDKTSEWRPVTLGIKTRTEVEILRGLKEGEELIIGAAAPAAGPRLGR
jgi:macrolide-specific efflux system membrane fusion protein